MKLESYKGLTALVTGASSGIGRLLALRLAREGARVILVARRKTELEEVAATIRDQGGEALALPCDVADAEQVKTSVSSALDHFGAIDILVNNAGYGGQRTFLEWELADMERMMQVNYFGAVYFTKALLPQMLEQGRGWIIFIASVTGRIASPEKSAYAASKFAMVGLADTLSLEVEDAGVQVLTVYPGVVRTPFFDEEMLERMPPKVKDKMIEPESVVDVIIDALAKGKHEVTFPGGMAAGYVVRALAPDFMRRQVKRVTGNS